MNSSNFVTGVLLGAVVGLTAGILLAPDKGSETRKKIKGKGKDLADTIKHQFSRQSDGEEMLDEAGNKVEDWAKKGKKKGKEIMDEGKEKIDELQGNASRAF